MNRIQTLHHLIANRQMKTMKCRQTEQESLQRTKVGGNLETETKWEQETTSLKAEKVTKKSWRTSARGQTKRFRK